jgi:hypothetical protein
MGSEGIRDLLELIDQIKDLILFEFGVFFTQFKSLHRI